MLFLSLVIIIGLILVSAILEYSRRTDGDDSLGLLILLVSPITLGVSGIFLVEGALYFGIPTLLVSGSAIYFAIRR